MPLVAAYCAEAVAARTAKRETMENCILKCGMEVVGRRGVERAEIVVVTWRSCVWKM